MLKNLVKINFKFPFHSKNLLVLICASFLFAGSSTPIAAQDQIRQDDRKNIRLLFKKAKKHNKKGEFAEAEKLFRSVLKINPQSTEAKLQLGYVLLKQRRLGESYALAFEVARAEPKNSFAFAILGKTLLVYGRFADARLALNNSLILDKREALAWAGWGMLDFYENRISDSLEKLRTAAFLQPNEPDFIFALATVSSRAEQYKEAAEAYQKYLRISHEADQERRDRIKGLISFLRYLGNKSSLYKLRGEKHTTVPVSLIGERPVIELRLKKNGESLKFVLDTGSGISVISKEASEKYKIKPITKGGKARAIGGDGTFPIVYGFINSVHIGDVEIENVPVYIRDFHGYNENIDGYIGISLISHFLMTLDYGSLTFSLDRKDSSRAELAEKDALFSPLRLTSSGFLSGEVLVEGVADPLNFIVDTGASISVISAELADSEEIRNYVDGGKLRVVGAAGITENVPSFLLPRVSFGSHSRKSLRAIALDLDLINEASGFEQSGILGGNFLKDYRLTFDFQNSKVIFVPHNK